MSNTSLGFIEITGVVAAVDALDIMCKTSGVELATWERKLGGRLVTIVVIKTRSPAWTKEPSRKCRKG